MQLKIEVTEPATGMAKAVARELAEHLAALAEHGRSHQVDLTSLPMSSGDKQELASLLGVGEVDITLHAMGESHIYETAFSGIWWVKHYSADEQLISELIEIASIPEIIKSPAADIELAAQALNQLIEQTDSSFDTGDDT
ncbi:MAG: hydrogenase expression/formation C-terminal domain-containing protein [Gammaproteobacteria bacterium]|nr:hydrogenase expression/formation C-terminal domain-containing protein [Gammaproteobacteria bacterium]